MWSRAWQWINERWPVVALFKFGVNEEIVGGARFAYTLGSATLVAFVMQVVTGVWQMFYYVPTTDHAYNSLSYLRTQVSFGWLIHGIHYWGANAMVVLLGLHMIRVFIWAAYKRPRELTWLVGVVLLLLTMAISFTGAPLPWDERGYWAAEVITGIVSTVPIVGDFAKRLMRGGEEMGQLTLSRFFMMHVAILPALLAICIGIHLVAFRQFGSVGPWNRARREVSGSFWPNAVFLDVLVGAIVFLAVITLSVYAFPSFSGPADPVDTTYVPKPEWNFLFFYQALKLFKGRLEPVGTLGLPILGIIILILIPFVDRREERIPKKRPFAMFFLLFSITAFIWLTIAGYLNKPVWRSASSSQTTSEKGSIQQGAGLFRSLGCSVCHQINEVGGNIGPNLSGEGNEGRSHDWLITQILNPKAHNPNSIMPGHPQLSARQTNALVDYLLSPHGKISKLVNKPDANTAKASPICAARTAVKAPGQAAFFIGNSNHGVILYRRTCESCHGPRGTDMVPNPGSNSGMVPPLNPISKSIFSNDAQAFAVNLDGFIQNGSISAGPSPAIKMPDFGASNTLTQPEIANIEAYIMALNKVNRAQIVHPGLWPEEFFFLTMVIAAVCTLGLGFARFLMSARRSSRNNGSV